jgi:hypothetical protein
MQISALPGIPAPFKKKAADDNIVTFTPSTVDYSQYPWLGAALGTTAGLGAGGKLSYNILKSLAERMSPAVAGVPDIPKILQKLQTVSPAAKFGGGARAALEHQLRSFKLSRPEILSRLNIGAKAPGSEAILKHLQSAPLLRAKGMKPSLEYAASEAARQFAGKRRGFVGGFKKFPLSRRVKGGILGLIPILLGGLGYYLGTR